MCIFLASPSCFYAADYYVSPNGSSGNDGTLSRPFDLATALSGSRTLPGDTLWLRGGTYKGTFYSALAGEAGAEITVRSYPDERATIDGAIAHYAGGYTIYRDFELWQSFNDRYSTQSGSFPSDLPYLDGFNLRAPNLKLINLVIHDVIGNGVAAWSEAPNCEIYGCLIYNNGWQGTDRGHGHAIYAQNQTGAKRIADNIMFNQFCNGIQIYGSSAAYLRNFTVEGNVSFNNGSISTDKEGGNMTIYGGAPISGLVVQDNITYNSYKSSGTCQFGASGTPSTDARIQNNYFMSMIRVADIQQITFTGNTVAMPNTIVELISSLSPLSSLTASWNNNTYCSQELLWQPFNLITASSSRGYGFNDWRAATGFDGASQYTRGKPAGTQIFMQPNEYEPGRATLTVFNWDGASFVTVNLGSVLAAGARYEVRNAQNWFATPVATGTYNGSTLTLPMTGLGVVTPNGVSTAPAATGPTFNVFVVRTTAAPIPITINSITVAPASASVTLGQDQQFTATANYSDGSVQDVTSATTWNSSDTTVATVSSAGLVTPLEAGEAVITGAYSGLSDTSTITVTGSATTTSTQTFANTTLITIRDKSTASPYPSAISVSGLAGTISKVTATIKNISHTWPEDIGILLVSPTGQAVVLMSHCVGSSKYKLNNATITFDDAAAAYLPDQGKVTTGTYRPTFGTAKTYPAPAPSGAYSTTLSALNGKNPNGNWSLYVVDSASGDRGKIAGGWSLTITTIAASALLPALVEDSYRRIPTGDQPQVGLDALTAPAWIKSVSLFADRQLRITCQGQRGGSYYLEASIDNQHWMPIGAVTAAAPMMEFIDNHTAAHAQRFYRVQQVPRIEHFR